MVQTMINHGASTGMLAALAGADAESTAGVSAGREKTCGIRDSGSVARWVPAGGVGRYKAPDWPQADNVSAVADKVNARTRICWINMMVKL